MFVMKLLPVVFSGSLLVLIAASYCTAWCCTSITEG
jgi:hypothetical protein